jgi:hypothetical protein
MFCRNIKNPCFFIALQFSLGIFAVLLQISPCAFLW